MEEISEKEREREREREREKIETRTKRDMRKIMKGERDKQNERI